MSDLDAIRERHRPLPWVKDGSLWCAHDSEPWGEHGCDAHQAIARVAELEAALQVEPMARALMAATNNSDRETTQTAYATAIRVLDALLARPESKRDAPSVLELEREVLDALVARPESLADLAAESAALARPEPKP